MQAMQGMRALVACMFLLLSLFATAAEGAIVGAIGRRVVPLDHYFRTDFIFEKTGTVGYHGIAANFLSQVTVQVASTKQHFGTDQISMQLHIQDGGGQYVSYDLIAEGDLPADLYHGRTPGTAIWTLRFTDRPGYSPGHVRLYLSDDENARYQTVEISPRTTKEDWVCHRAPCEPRISMFIPKTVGTKGFNFVYNKQVRLFLTDQCPDHPKSSIGVCGCDTLDTDSDSDGTPNCHDLCIYDPNKVDPGQCGCNELETDTDKDGTADCIDDCPIHDVKTHPGWCGCASLDTDTDKDGTADCVDLCPFHSPKTAPGLCGCETADTLDTDKDGTPDCMDRCPTDPAKVVLGICGCFDNDEADQDMDGTPNCIDGCPTDPAKTIPSLCGCHVADIDTDKDGTPDCRDFCPDDPAKTVPGLCLCGTPDVDTDTDGAPDCSDNCPNDPAKTEPGICDCGTPDTDTDNDGTPDCNDNCPGDLAKTEPGQCDCGTPDTDTDTDGVSDCLDECPEDPAKTKPGHCDCGNLDTDTDNDGVADCNDNCPNDPAKTEPGICDCGTPDTDTDNDGTPDCNDNCPEDLAKTEPGQCDCGTPDTDTDEDGTPNCKEDCDFDPFKLVAGQCGCGNPDIDTDTDGVADCNDECPNDSGKTAPGQCDCGTPDTDTDNDGVADCNDNCPNDPAKTEPGTCDCGTPDTDTDTDGTPDCNDNCPEDLAKTEPGQCGCGNPDIDTDTDGVADCNDECPNDSGKTAPGQCDCGTPDTDTDNDGVADCNDNCPNDPAKTEPGTCDCGTPDTDTDKDGTPDCNDNCPEDPAKTEPGICDCGTLDTDTDSDETPDCIDNCPEDPAKTEPGLCLCGTPDTDTDRDETPDCNDNCPEDPAKTEPGQCLCGTPDTDTDSDSVADCLDKCPNDPHKTMPGSCGCGTSDKDSDGDSTADCMDLCPNDPAKTLPGHCGCGFGGENSPSVCCGNGNQDSWEECDDSNLNDEDGCSSSCRIEWCGDGVRQPEMGEWCDDGNTDSGDGCSSECLVESEDETVTTVSVGVTITATSAEDFAVMQNAFCASVARAANVPLSDVICTVVGDSAGSRRMLSASIQVVATISTDNSATGDIVVESLGNNLANELGALGVEVVSISQAQVVETAPPCNLVQACAPPGGRDEHCRARQSTYARYGEGAAALASDGNPDSCLKTAKGTLDPNPQWVSVDLEQERLIGTVRFWAKGSETDFTVYVASSDAGPGLNQRNEVVVNPTFGGIRPLASQNCAVKSAGPGMFEAECDAATKGQFVFITATAPQEELEVCEVQVFKHVCMEAAELECGLGLEPAACTECPGCVPCRPGFYSNTNSSSQCIRCPGNPLPYSPPGSTSMFQCEGVAQLDSTSTLEVDEVLFNPTLDTWELDVVFSLAPRIQIDGLAAFFISDGGDTFNSDIYAAKNFPCSVDVSWSPSDDLSNALSETVCCLQDLRQDYVTTKIFRDYTDTLDLVAANDKCDAEDGSNMLVNAGLEVVGEGSEFVDTNGNIFANSITVTPLPPVTGTVRQRAKITIPDAELYKISRPAGVNNDGNLNDSRELFIGLLDMLPTGTRVVDSSSQQVPIILTRTQYGAFAAYGEQSIDYDFINHLTGRVHGVFNQSARRAGLVADEFYAEISYVYDDRLKPAVEMFPVDVDTVSGDVSCSAAVSTIVSGQDCGPKELAWETENCPQISIPEDNFGRIYIPLESPPPASTVHISFDLVLTDKDNRTGSLTVAMDLVTDDYVSWCDTDEGSVDLAERVIPSVIIGTEVDNPPRITTFADQNPLPFTTNAETLQDGLITLVLDLNETAGLDANLEVYLEDVLVVHVNPGSDPDFSTIETYKPTYQYDPDTRDAWMVIPPELVNACPAADVSESFFGCTHKHIVRDKTITNETDCYQVGSAPPPDAAGAQDFMENMLGSGTASQASRELGRDFEAYLMGTGVLGRKKVALWINPGHQWGQEVQSSKYSLSQYVIFYVLYGVNSGVDATRRSMLQVTSDGTNTVAKTIKYNVDAAAVVEAVLGDVVVVPVKVTLAVQHTEACLPTETLKTILAARLQAAVAPHSSEVRKVHVLWVEVVNADCDGEQRRASGHESVVKIDAVIALAKRYDTYIDMDAVVASGVGVLSMEETDSSLVSPAGARDPSDSEGGDETAGGSGSSSTTIAAAAGAVAGVVLLSLVGWKTYSRYANRDVQGSDDATMTMGASHDRNGEATGSVSKAEIEGMLLVGDFERPDSNKSAFKLLDSKSAVLAAKENQIIFSCKRAVEDISMDMLVGGSKQ